MFSVCFRSVLIGLAFKNNFVLPEEVPRRIEHQGLKIRSATKADVESTTVLIQEAYHHWVSVGIPVSPAFQQPKDTRRHLIKGGFVVENEKHEIVATFSLEEAFVQTSASKPNQWIVYFSNPRDKFVFSSLQVDASFSPYKKFLVFKKLAVHPDWGNKGLGRILFDVAEQIASQNQGQYQGLMLETVREANWLHQWYLSLGFEEVGAKTYPGSSFQTILMVKKL